MSKEFFCATTALNDDGDHTWILRGLGSMSRITRVEPCTIDGESGFRVYHTGPDWALCVVAGTGFVHVDDRPEVCPHCQVSLPVKDPFPVLCFNCDKDIDTPTRQWNE